MTPNPPPTKPVAVRNRLGLSLLAATLIFLAGAIIAAYLTGAKSPADPSDAQQIARGKPLYDKYCASCHGARMEGQSNWQKKLSNDRMPAPPHDASGHTWHHPDAVLFGITKHGLIPGKYAPPGYKSDMPAYANMLTDEEIWAVLAYIKSYWPPEIRRAQQDVNSRSRR